MRSCPLCERTYGDDVTVCEIDGSILREAGPRQDPLIGKIVRSRYRVLKKLGEGGMGSVYLAEQIAINRNVALKILHPDYARDPEFVRRFRQEAKLAASLSHHNIVTIFDFDQADDGSLYIVMEYVAGRSLSAVIKAGLLDVGTAVRLATQIAEGLRAAHAAGVIHRDIKPENIMVLPGNEIKLMDFGIARLSNVEGVTRLTRSGMIMGTPTYMAPEQIEGGEVGVATDIYAFGVLLYEMLSGQVPFTAPTPGAVLIKHLTEAAPPLRKLRNDIPASLEKVVRQALEKKPERRQRNMDEVVELLSRSQHAPAADRKSIFSAVGGLVRSAFSRATGAERLRGGTTGQQKVEQPLDTAFRDARFSTPQAGDAEPASPVGTSETHQPVPEPPDTPTIDLPRAPVVSIPSGPAETIPLTERQSHSAPTAAPVTPSAAAVAQETVALTEIQSQPAAAATPPDRPDAPVAAETIALTETLPHPPAAAAAANGPAAPLRTETVAYTETQAPFSGSEMAAPYSAPATLVESSATRTVAETIATTATPRIRRAKSPKRLYAASGALAALVAIAMGFFFYQRQTNEPKTAATAMNAAGSTASAEKIEPPRPETLPAQVESKVELPPPESRQEFPSEADRSKARPKPEEQPHEKKPAPVVPAPPVSRAAVAKAEPQKAPEIKAAPAKERTEVAKVAPVPERAPVKKVEEPVKLAEKPKETDYEKNKNSEALKRDSESAKKESETKIAAIDKAAIKPPDKPAVKQPDVPPPQENRLVSLAIVSGKRDINVKERLVLTVKGKYANGNENEIVGGVRFESSDADVAAVNSRGEVEGKKEGKADVVARYSGVVSRAYTVYVKGSPEKPKEEEAGERLQDQRRRLLR